MPSGFEMVPGLKKSVLHSIVALIIVIIVIVSAVVVPPYFTDH